MSGAEPPPSPSFRFGTFEVDLSAGELRKCGLRIKLQDQPFHLLVLLLQHPGEVLTREQLRSTLWSDHTFVDFDRGLNRAMNKLRVALCDSAECPRFIETLPRRGYRFIAPIISHSPIADSRAIQPGNVVTSVPNVENPNRSMNLKNGPSFSHRPIISRPGQTYFLVVALLLFCSMAVFYMRSRTASGTIRYSASPAGAKRVKRSVAVLGFKNLSNQPDEEWIATALTDWLTTQLAAGGQLRLIAPEHTARMKLELSLGDVNTLSADNLARVANDLSTDIVLVGSYAVLPGSSATQVRLDLRLLDARSGVIVDATSQTGTKTHLLDLVSQAGQQLRSSLGVTPVSSSEAAEIAVVLPRSQDAARFYSEGLERLRMLDALGARDLLEKAITLDPAHALSHSALATAWATLGYDELSRAEAKRAFELSSDLPRAERLLVAARFHQASKRWVDAIDEYRALVEFFPDNLDYGLSLADAQVSSGNSKDAQHTLVMLRKLPAPLSEDVRIDIADARTAESLGDFEADLQYSSRAVEKARNLGASLLLAQARMDQTWALTNLGRPDDAAVAVNEAEHIFSRSGDKRGRADSTNLSGILMENQGDALGAKREYEEALAIFRGLGNQMGMAAELDNLGDVLFSLGELRQSRQHYEDAMSIYRDLDHQNGVCLTKGALGSVLLALGDDAGAIQVSQEGVNICNKMGDRSKSAIALLNLGRALRLQGKASEASAAESEAVSAFEAIGDKQSAARARLMMAELLLDGDNLQAAQSTSIAAADEFAKEKAARDAALAYAVLSQVLLREGSLLEARKAIEESSNYLTRCSDREAEMMVAMAAARVEAVSGSMSQEDAARALQQIVAKANHLGFVPYELEPQLALAEIELTFGDGANARSHLEAVQKEAVNRGFGLIALKAAGDLKNLQSSDPRRQ
jgi:eukaryotic-like serine/threonine-protein kinase